MGILLKSQYSVKYSNGELAKTSSPTTPYIGPYLDTIFNTQIEGDSIKNQGEILIPTQQPQPQEEENFFEYDDLKPDIEQQANLRSPNPGNVIPTEQQYKNNNFVRYFFLDLRTKTFIEVDKVEYNKRSQIDTNIFKTFVISWDLRNPDSNVQNVNRLKKLGSVKISPYDYIK